MLLILSQNMSSLVKSKYSFNLPLTGKSPKYLWSSGKPMLEPLLTFWLNLLEGYCLTTSSNISLGLISKEVLAYPSGVSEVFLFTFIGMFLKNISLYWLWICILKVWDFPFCQEVFFLSFLQMIPKFKSMTIRSSITCSLTELKEIEPLFLVNAPSVSNKPAIYWACISNGADSIPFGIFFVCDVPINSGKQEINLLNSSLLWDILKPSNFLWGLILNFIWGKVLTKWFAIS